MRRSRRLIAGLLPLGVNVILIKWRPGEKPLPGIGCPIGVVQRRRYGREMHLIESRPSRDLTRRVGEINGRLQRRVRLVVKEVRSCGTSELQQISIGAQRG